LYHVVARVAGSGYSSHVADRNGGRPALNADSRIALSTEQVSCDLDGQVAIVNLANGVYYGLDSTATCIWTLLAEPRTFGDICDSMLRMYDVEPAILEADVRAFVGDLAVQGLVVIT
jgi:coenzyme PQQ synthesis protein D (PqqD)